MLWMYCPPIFDRLKQKKKKTQNEQVSDESFLIALSKLWNLVLGVGEGEHSSSHKKRFVSFLTLVFLKDTICCLLLEVVGNDFISIILSLVGDL